MTYTVKVRDGHHVVRMYSDEEIKCATDYINEVWDSVVRVVEEASESFKELSTQIIESMEGSLNGIERDKYSHERYHELGNRTRSAHSRPIQANVEAGGGVWRTWRGNGKGSAR